MNLVTIFDPDRKVMLIFCLFYIINVTILDASYAFSTDKAMVKRKICQHKVNYITSNFTYFKAPQLCHIEIMIH